MASKTVNITYKTGSTVPFNFPDLDTLPDNNALKHIELYVSAFTTVYTGFQKIGKLKDLSNETNINLSDSKNVAISLFFRFTDNRCNNENYNDLVYLGTGSTNYFWKFRQDTQVNGYFQIYTTDFANISSTSVKNMYGLTADFPDEELKCSQPIATPTSSSVAIGTNVTLSTQTENANIYYTLDGTTPDENSNLYTSPIAITQDTTIKAITIKTGYTNSDILTSAYTIALPTTKSIDVTIKNTLYNQVKSDIEFFYSICDNPNEITNPIVSLGKLPELTSNILHIEYSSLNLGVFILYKYNTDDITTNSSNSDNFLEMGISSNLKSYGIYNTDINKFIFSKNNVFKVYSENDTELTISEKTYALQILPIIENHFTVTPKKLTYSLAPETITLQAETGYFFSNPPTLTLKNPIGSSVKTFTLSADSKTATLTIQTTDLDNKFISNTNIIVERQTEISDKYGLITLYKPTNEQLKELSTKLLYKYNVDSEKIELIDLSKYILSFISLPLDIEIYDNKIMTLNSISTGVTMSYLNDNIVSLNFGDISITGFYNNSIDYKNTKINIYLPFVDNVTLDTSKYMNKIINLSYRVDLFTGDFIAIIKVNNIVYDTFSGNCSIQIPFINKVSGSDISIKDYSNNNLLDDKTPKIIVSSNIKNDDVIIDTNYYTTLNSLSGFNIIDNFEESTSSHLTKDDLDNISNLLRQGVIF